MSKPALVPIGSWWSSNRSPARVFIVIERLPFGRVCIKEEGEEELRSAADCYP